MLVRRSLRSVLVLYLGRLAFGCSGSSSPETISSTSIDDSLLPTDCDSQVLVVRSVTVSRAVCTTSTAPRCTDGEGCGPECDGDDDDDGTNKTTCQASGSATYTAESATVTLTHVDDGTPATECTAEEIAAAPDDPVQVVLGCPRPEVVVMQVQVGTAHGTFPDSALDAAYNDVEVKLGCAP